MLNTLLSFLSEDSKLSSLRLMSLLCVLAAIGTATYCIYTNRDLIGTSALVAAFLAPAFAAKVISKKDEK